MKKNKNNKKRIKIISAITAVVLVIAITAVTIATNKTAETAFNTKMTLLLMPDSLSTAFDGKDVTFYVRENKKFDSKKESSQPLNAFEFYYYDDDGNEVNLGSDGTYKTKSIDIMPSVLFLMKTNENLAKVKSIGAKVGVVLVVLVFALVIVLWYKSWSKRQDKEKEKKYKNKK